MKIRKYVFGFLLFLLVIALAGCGHQAESKQSSDTGNQKTIRIGYQKYGTLNILKAKGTLEKRLAALGYSIKWTEFPGGPQLLEALRVGEIDLGHTGEAPPIFAQAAGAPLVYLGHEPASPKSEAILVHKQSSIQKVSDLKGKKVALNKGSNVHYLLVKQLEKAGLKYKDIQPRYLPPADARAAFERGSVDAWVIWDPYFAAAQTVTQARILADGQQTVSNYEFYLASRQFIQTHRDLIPTIFAELEKTAKWAEKNPHQLAELLSPQLGIDVKSLEVAAKRRNYGVQKMSNQVIAEQQKVAETFLKLGLIPKAIKVKDAVLDIR
ncbi:sulfonate ABC transporter substrate-binding protein [Thermoflavimicrobium dichotomicum]|uniref:Putative aliphatic sulfonates-binding protein n=1 Tax=Thermoflavimicrobium dichotomicum TaxID=46223 RepID=A0A1I3RVJ1_9BACL|nr:sulfonate ABC transporter substrate-binding protein [Thermoflavimicrobium dichotomicum]SFJ49256.1 sulfonate transport system substrate-binding protein [Thermoflavimicrobium dichotomicum]